MTSPKIHHIEWGAIDADGLARVRDLKAWPGGGRAWDWRETNTRHVPGIQVADVQELLEHGARVVVLSRGMELRLRTSPLVFEHLRLARVAVHVEETKKAVQLYNDLAARGELVGGLFHSTC